MYAMHDGAEFVCLSLCLSWSGFYVEMPDPTPLFLYQVPHQYETYIFGPSLSLATMYRVRQIGIYGKWQLGYIGQTTTLLPSVLFPALTKLIILCIIVVTNAIYDAYYLHQKPLCEVVPTTSATLSSYEYELWPMTFTAESDRDSVKLN